MHLRLRQEIYVHKNRYIFGISMFNEMNITFKKYQCCLNKCNIIFPGVLANRVWNVAHYGMDGDGCGDHHQPCSSISRAINSSTDGDTIRIHVDPNGLRDGDEFIECDNLVIDKSLTLIGYGGMPQIGCSDRINSSHADRNTIFSVITPRHAYTNVVFKNVKFKNGYIFVSNGYLGLYSCSLVDAAVRGTTDCQAQVLYILNSDISISEPPPDDNLAQYDTSFFCQYLNVNITNTTAYDVNLNFVGNLSCHVNVDNCTFGKLLAAETGMGGVNITVAQENGSVIVANSLFENFVHFDPIQSSINIEASVLRIESHRSLYDTFINSTIHISHSTFRDNERAVSISRHFRDIVISRSHFERNAVMHAAAAVRLAIGQADHVHFDYVTFVGNAAGYNTHEPIPNKFEYDGSQIRIKEKKVNGIIALVGKGGAVRIHRGQIKFTGCTFINNTASLLGGAIFVAKNGTIQLNNCSFMNSDIGVHSMQGDMIYSSGNVTVINSTFTTRTAMDHISILRHSGDPWSINVKSLWFECPVGYRLVMVNATSHRVVAMVGLVRSHKLDQLYYYCQTCGNNQYSTNKGFVNFTVTTTDDHFYTLMINGSQPFDSHPVDYKFGDITCRQCPYGGDCEGDIKAVANFWGYSYNEHIYFQHCPPDYCCTSTQCSGVAECAPYRYGRLCGRCVKGYSESLFSNACVPNTDCASYWVWATVCTMGLVYTIFLISQKELRDFVASGNWDLIQCHRKRKEKAKDPDEGRECVEMLSPVIGEMPALDASEDNVTETVTKPKFDYKETQPTADKHQKSAGTLIILFYYFQDSLLLHIETIYTRTVSKFIKRLKNFLVGLFWFRLDFFQFLDSVCIFPDLQPVEKLLFKALFVPYVLMILGFVFVIHRVIQMICRGCRPHDHNLTVSHNNNVGNTKTASFSCRLASGFTLAMLFTYQKMATTTFALLNCVPVGNLTVLHMDGSRECFELWQFGAMLYAGICVGPFCLILMLGPPLLRHRIINVSHFCVGCLMPLPSIVYWIYQYVKLRQRNHGQVIGRENNINEGSHERSGLHGTYTRGDRQS